MSAARAAESFRVDFIARTNSAVKALFRQRAGPMSIRIKAINFHDAATGSSHYHMGTHGYSIPQGHGAISVDFQITEDDGQYLVLTEVLRGRFLDHNAIVQRAYQQLGHRLARFAKYAELIEAQTAKKEEQRTA